MATEAQRRAAKKNIRKALKVWEEESRARRRAEGKERRTTHRRRRKHY